MKTFRTIILLSTMLCAFIDGSSCVGTPEKTSESCISLRIQVRGMEDREGRIMIAIYNSPATFLKKPFGASSVVVDNTSVVSSVLKIPKGKYAVSLFHDANGNGKLDVGSFGIPIEKYGFSTDAEGFMGPPSFRSSVLNIVRDTTINITLR